ncbi:hypothetical protein LFL96_09555 [Paraburkholderia sp. D15]|nr:hypothetical protein [Paraburkholderia sp. D15]WGS51716.1 hypothetical protein LFL96_09555 [Paraburkholderia sp. D15]
MMVLADRGDLASGALAGVSPTRDGAAGAANQRSGAPRETT